MSHKRQFYLKTVKITIALITGITTAEKAIWFNHHFDLLIANHFNITRDDRALQNQRAFMTSSNFKLKAYCIVTELIICF